VADVAEDHMTERHLRRAIIIGCGIAGPAVGMFLRRVGIESVVCERRPTEASDEGLFLGVAPNGMNVLTELGLRDSIEAVSVACNGFEFRNARGDVIGAIDRRRDEANYGARLQMIRRGDLHRVLTSEARRAGVDVQFGRSLVAVDQHDSSTVVAHFMDGGQERGDVVIGCDGIHSTARSLTIPRTPDPTYSGLLDFGGFARCPVPVPTGVNVMVFGGRSLAPSRHRWGRYGGFTTAARRGTRCSGTNPLCARTSWRCTSTIRPGFATSSTPQSRWLVPSR
jgi:2-polyprenyl-6-methoxyphenol hydroxylase-like FAD-dependent oxidoreductase